MSKQFYKIFNDLENLLSEDNNLELFRKCISEFQGHIDSCISSLSRDENEAYESFNKMLSLAEKIDEVINTKETPMFTPAYTIEWFKENNIDINSIDKIYTFFDVLLRVGGLQTGICLYSGDNSYQHDEGVETFENINLCEYIEFRHNKVTYEDMLTYFSPEVLEVFKKNNVIIKTDKQEDININKVDLNAYIETGESYDS